MQTLFAHLIETVGHISVISWLRAGDPCSWRFPTTLRRNLTSSFAVFEQRSGAPGHTRHSERERERPTTTALRATAQPRSHGPRKQIYFLEIIVKQQDTHVQIILWIYRARLLYLKVNYGVAWGIERWRVSPNWRQTGPGALGRGGRTCSVIDNGAMGFSTISRGQQCAKDAMISYEWPDATTLLADEHFALQSD